VLRAPRPPEPPLNTPQPSCKAHRRSPRKVLRLDARISAQTAAQVESLARAWGVLGELSRADVVIEAVRRAWEAERRR
jgi:hypothetical protein